MLQAGIEYILEPGLLNRAKPKFSSAEEFDFTVFGTTFDFVLARSIWTHASKEQICSMLSSFVRTASPAGVFLTSYRPASLSARGTRRSPAAERLASRWALAARVPSPAPLVPSIGAAMWDYRAAEWVGQSHKSSLPGMVHHSFRWIAHECARRGLRVRELGYGVVNHQRWLRIERRPAGRARPENGLPHRTRPLAPSPRARKLPGKGRPEVGICLKITPLDTVACPGQGRPGLIAG